MVESFWDPAFFPSFLIFRDDSNAAGGEMFLRKSAETIATAYNLHITSTCCMPAQSRLQFVAAAKCCICNWVKRPALPQLPRPLEVKRGVATRCIQSRWWRWWRRCGRHSRIAISFCFCFRCIFCGKSNAWVGQAFVSQVCATNYVGGSIVHLPHLKPVFALNIRKTQSAQISNIYLGLRAPRPLRPPSETEKKLFIALCV